MLDDISLGLLAGGDEPVSRLSFIIVFLALSFLVYRIGLIWHNLFLHPLRNFPGPKVRAASYLPNVISIASGRDFINIKSLHDKHGPVVRIAPNILSFNTAEAFQDVYGFQKGRKQIPKDLEYYLPENVHAQRSLINADDADHSRMRRLVAHAFSNSALQEQEDMLKTYFDLLVDRLKTISRISGTANMADFFSFLTWDIIGDLSLGQPFGMLEQSTPPSFMWRVMGASNAVVLYWIGSWVPFFGLGLRLFLKLPGGSDARARLKAFAYEQVSKRLAEKPERPDFISQIVRHNDGRAMSDGEIIMTARTFLNAGSETTATTLAWCLWEILQDLEVHERLRKEVRGRFRHADKITMHSTSSENLPFLFAVVEETLRKNPAIVGPAFARKTAEPTLIDGNLVPPNVRVGVHHYAAFRSDRNFRDPERFIPERWLGDARYRNDRTEAFHPFQLGPRVCLGKNLAYAEMTCILARLFYYFDMSLAADSVQWGKAMKAYMFWVKPPLMVNFRLANHLKEDERILARLRAA